MWIIKWIPYFVIGALLEGIGQVLFKKGSTSHSEDNGWRYYLCLAGSKWIWIGLGCYGVEMLIWLFLLFNIPLSIAFPLSGIQQLIVIAFSVFFLKEKINKLEWMGVSFIAIGIALIAKMSG